MHYRGAVVVVSSGGGGGSSNSTQTTTGEEEQEQSTNNHSTSSTTTTTNVRRRRRKSSSKNFFYAYQHHHDRLLHLSKTRFVFLLLGGMIVVLCCVTFTVKVSHYLRRRQVRLLIGRSRRSSSSSSFQVLSEPRNPKDQAGEPDVKEWNPIYRVPESMETLGDRSDQYARLRKDIDGTFPEDPVRSLLSVRELTKHTFESFPMMNAHDKQDPIIPYDIHNCPETPPAGYPFAWNVLDLLNHWPADDTTVRSRIYQGLCIFDYRTDYNKAVKYRDLALPFVVQNDPAVARTAERWNIPGYMENLLGKVPHRTEYSDTNHFMYWLLPPPAPAAAASAQQQQQQHYFSTQAATAPDGWREPTKPLRMTYRRWLKHANVSDEHTGPNQPHWYFRLIGCGLMGDHCDNGSSEYLFDEMPFFQPKRDSLYLVDSRQQRGIHCRFGMKGIIAENHFDTPQNAIAVLAGSRRYILAHPDQCEKLALYPMGHPSARHSEVDWSNPDLMKFPQFATVQANEVVLQAGQVMFLPTNWFHYIVNLELNYQCNTRSGVTADYPLDQCGFHVKPNPELV